jgi:hypothetical protein
MHINKLTRSTAHVCAVAKLKQYLALDRHHMDTGRAP